MTRSGTLKFTGLKDGGSLLRCTDQVSMVRSVNAFGVLNGSAAV